MFGARELSVFMGELALVPITGDDIVNKAAARPTSEGAGGLKFFVLRC